MVLPDGHTIFEAGDPSPVAYLVESGDIPLTVPVAEGRTEVVAKVGDGELLGDMTTLTGRSRTTAAHVRGDAVLWEIPAETLKKVVESDAAIASQMAVTAMSLVMEKDLAVAARTHEKNRLA